MAEVEPEGRRAPYNVTWTTFINVIEKFELATVPNRIDGSYLNSMAGGIRPYFIAAMKFFGLLDDGNRTTPQLRELVSLSTEQRKGKIAEMLSEHYPFEELARSNATADELLEAIKSTWGGEGDTARKQMSFYLQGCRWAGLPLSPHWPVGKPGTGAARATRKAAATRSRRTTKSAEPPMPYNERSAEHRDVTLASGMKLTLTASMPLLSLPADELSEVLVLIQTFDSLAAKVHKEDANN